MLRLPILITVLLIVCGWLPNPAAAQDNLPQLVRAVKPSAVAIETFGGRGERVARGSGFFVAVDKIVTNRHVVENAARVEIKSASGKVYQSSGIVAVDGEGDLAMLEVAGVNEAIQPLSLEKVVPQEGESIVVIGNPYGLEGSVSNGIVAAVREIAGYGRIIQITAAISPGSSGSPVVNMRGQVVGVATLQATEGQNINFAVPSARIANLKIGAARSFVNFNHDSRDSKRANAEKFYLQGLNALAVDDYNRAAKLFEKAVQIDADYAEAWYQTGFAYGSLGKHSESLRATAQALRMRPDWTEANINAGASAFALGRFKDAENYYRSVVKVDAANPNVQFALGLTLNKLNRADEEILAYKRAVAVKPDFAAAFEKLGAAYFRSRRFGEALTAFEQVKILKGDAKSYDACGETLLELGRLDESVETLTAAVGLDPNLWRARYNLGRAYLKQNNQAAALGQYELLKESNAEYADKLYVLIYP